MDSEKKSIWQIRLATLSIFLLGFVAGAFALHSYHLWFSASSGLTKQERYEEAFNRLGLNEAQKTEVRQIVGETREKLQKLRQESDPRVQEIRAQNDENLQRVLTPEQWQRFQQEREKIRQTEKPPVPPKQLKLQ
jgi:Spy/CpxP family protein refolding chaperone